MLLWINHRRNHPVITSTEYSTLPVFYRHKFCIFSPNIGPAVSDQIVMSHLDRPTDHFGCTSSAIAQKLPELLQVFGLNFWM